MMRLDLVMTLIDLIYNLFNMNINETSLVELSVKFYYFEAANYDFQQLLGSF